MQNVFFILFFYKPKTTPKNSLLRKKNGMEQASLHWDLLKHIFFFFTPVLSRVSHLKVNKDFVGISYLFHPLQKPEGLSLIYSYQFLGTYVTSFLGRYFPPFSSHQEIKVQGKSERSHPINKKYAQESVSQILFLITWQKEYLQHNIGQRKQYACKHNKKLL